MNFIMIEAIYFFILRTVVTEFIVGRVLEGQFEYPALNGWMTPGRAKEICDQDPACGGFTYKVCSRKLNNLNSSFQGSVLLDREFDIFFFHLIINVQKDEKSWKWIYYLPDRVFSRFPGTFEYTEDSVGQIVHEHEAEDVCEGLEACVAIVKEHGNSEAKLLNYLNMGVLDKTTGIETFVKIRNLPEFPNIYEKPQWEDIDRCCPKHNAVNTEKALNEVNDTVIRISCDIPTNDFLETYVRKRRPVMLVNCTKDWLAQSTLSLNSLMNEQIGPWRWQTNFKFQDQERQTGHLTGSDIRNILDGNGTVSIFDEIGKRRHRFNKDNNKTFLFNHYEKPSPLPQDYFDMSGILTNYQWIVIAQKDTGRYIHTSVLVHG